MKRHSLFSAANLERSSEYERSRDAVIRKVEELNTLRSRFEELTVAQQVASEKLAPSNIQVILKLNSIQSYVCNIMSLVQSLFTARYFIKQKSTKSSHLGLAS